MSLKVITEESYEAVPTTDEAEKIDAIENGKEEKFSNREKYYTAAAIFYGNIALGCAVCAVAPSLTAFQNKYSTDDATISRVFIVSTSCFFIAGVTAGFVYNRFNRQIVVIASFALMALTVLLIPHAPTMTLFFIAVGILDLCAGFYDVAQFVWIPEMMEQKCPPYVQAQHFFFAVGANLSGLILAPFLDNGKDGHPSRLKTPFAIIGGLVIVSMVIQMLLRKFYPYRPEVGSADENQAEIENSNNKMTSSWPWEKLRLVILTCAFFCAHLSMEVTLFKFFPKFIQNSELHLSQQESAYVYTGMTTTFAVGRLLGIFTVLKIRPQILLCCNIVIVFTANILLIGWGQQNLNVLWASSIIFGVGLSTTMGSITAYVERFLAITNTMGSLILVSGSVAVTLFQAIVGNFIETNPGVLCYLNFLSIAFMIVSFGTMSWITKINPTRFI